MPVITKDDRSIHVEVKQTAAEIEEFLNRLSDKGFVEVLNVTVLAPAQGGGIMVMARVSAVKEGK